LNDREDVRKDLKQLPV
jgi:hypothetical protein